MVTTKKKIYYQATSLNGYNGLKYCIGIYKGFENLAETNSFNTKYYIVSFFYVKDSNLIEIKDTVFVFFIFQLNSFLFLNNKYINKAIFVYTYFWKLIKKNIKELHKYKKFLINLTASYRN